MADGVAHPAHLPVAALHDRDLDLSWPERPDLGGSRRAVLEHDPVPQSMKSPLADGSTRDPRPIGLGNFKAGMGEQMGKLPVVGEQQQPFAVEIQAPHRVEAAALVREQLHHGEPVVWVAGSAEHPDGLVQRVDGGSLESRKQPTVDGDRLRCRDVPRRIAHYLPAHRHSSLRDQRLAGAPGGHAGMSEVLCEPHLAAR